MTDLQKLFINTKVHFGADLNSTLNTMKNGVFFAEAIQVSTSQWHLGSSNMPGNPDVPNLHIDPSEAFAEVEDTLEYDPEAAPQVFAVRWLDNDQLQLHEVLSARGEPLSIEQVELLTISAKHAMGQ